MNLSVIFQSTSHYIMNWTDRGRGFIVRRNVAVIINRRKEQEIIKETCRISRENQL